MDERVVLVYLYTSMIFLVFLVVFLGRLTGVGGFSSDTMLFIAPGASSELLDAEKEFNVAVDGDSVFGRCGLVIRKLLRIKNQDAERLHTELRKSIVSNGPTKSPVQSPNCCCSTTPPHRPRDPLLRPVFPLHLLLPPPCCVHVSGACPHVRVIR